MKPGTIPRVDLPRKQHQLPPHRIGHWVLAGTPSTEPYPCTCRYDPCRYLKCPDRYRTEGDALPPACCGRAGHTREADAGRVAAELARNAPGFVQPDRRTTWERRLPTQPGAVVAEAGLWDTGEEEPPPAWDAIDEVSGSHGESLEDAFGHLDTLGHLEGAEEDAEERWRAEVDKRRAGVAAGHCDCPTPWDTDPPSLLLAAGPKATAPDSVHELSAKAGADTRADADTALELADERRAKPWKQGRHALLPPVAGAKTQTRECWTAPLASGRVAVIDLPPEPRGGGVHCPDCHTHWRSAGAYEMHRPKSPGHPAGVCRNPAMVRLVMAGSTADNIRWGPPLLKRDLAGVWSVDTQAVWGPDGPPAQPQAGWA
jgi:hypothetical protein